ncbi:hypothetical protein FOJ82_04820 [Tessaracoccus rhinocerotis]|uniref:Uncharacterized protein n=1 Tax=Tessaracoccus rhinocerotis TaxID=1689449 RepID=A0A553K653_9ACTN|nr:hypothetical protein [Tessaracoccus rhinocerotis]TRY20187.1 hypothetical protein FOJ82_04820 [Tessaracoccus rhinocerotis]
MTESTTPNIDQQWRDDFVLAMRMADVPGERIGDALATVDAHCAEAGETAAESFGDPEAYALSLAPEPAGGLQMSFAAGIFAGLLGLLTVPRAVTALSAGTDVSVTLGDVVALGVTLGLAATVLALPRKVLPWLARAKFSLVWLVGVLLLAALVPSLLLLRQVIAEITPLAVLALGVVLLAGSVAWTSRYVSRPDPVQDPRSGKAPRGRTQWVTALLFPILTALVLLVDAAFRALS